MITIAHPRGPHSNDRHANPWAGRCVCPRCDSALWTLPWDEYEMPGRWRCVECHIDFRPAAEVAA